MANTGRYQPSSEYVFKPLITSILRESGFRRFKNYLQNTSDLILVQTPAATWISQLSLPNLEPWLKQDQSFTPSQEIVWPNFWTPERIQTWNTQQLIVSSEVIVTQLDINNLPQDESNNYIITMTDLHRLQHVTSPRRVQFASTPEALDPFIEIFREIELNNLHPLSSTTLSL